MRKTAQAVMLCAAAAAASALATLATPSAAQAAAPMVKTQAPGFYRVMVGDFEVTALNDGAFDLPVDEVLKQAPETTLKELARYDQKPPVETSVNAFLINTGTKLVLIDTGAGGAMAPSTGALLANLQAAGYRPEQVDDIFITHLHDDHLGGLMHDGVAVFPNATVHAGKRDTDLLNAEVLAKAPADAKEGIQIAMAAYAPYIAGKKFAPIAGDGEVVPGIKSWATPGHTPGHTSYVVESRGQTMIVTGDLIHVAAVQFDHPDVTISFDNDPKAAAASRAKVFAQAARSGTLIAAAHLQFPGMGRLKADGKGWRFVPINYLRMR